MSENVTPMKMKKTSYQKLVAPYQEEALNTLKEYIAIPSVLDTKTASAKAPFGAGVEKALAYVAALGEKLGFKVDRCDNYITELTYGEGKKTLDIYAHSDVVPVKKENWKHDPFALTLEDGLMYGRGTSDDKGPGIACLYAVKALMDKGKLDGYKLRFLFGGNEENDSLGLKHYFETLKRPYPTLGFSPDADYPLIYAEKSIYSYTASYPMTLLGLEPFTVGDALNIVPAEASCKIKVAQDRIPAMLASYLTRHNRVKATFDGETLTFYGKPYHGSAPWNGVNAGLYLLHFLSKVYANDTLKQIFIDYYDGLGNPFGGNFSDEYFTESSYNVGKIVFDGEKLTLYVNVRFPAAKNVEEVLANVASRTGAEVKLLGGSTGFVSDPKSTLVTTLLDSYIAETGDKEAKPLSIGGGTYARESKNAVAFGAQFPGRDYHMHGDDEYFPLSDFYDNMQIYAHAVDALGEYLRTK